MKLLDIDNDIIYSKFSESLSYKYYVMLHITCNKLYNNKLPENTLKNIYFTPKNEFELAIAVNKWCENKSISKRIYGDINRWNTMNITNMSHLFYCKVYFNDNIDDWIVNKVKDMSYMFYCACHYNQPLNSWNVKNVENMMCMFNTAAEFDQPLDNWNIDNLCNANYLFANAFKFNQNLSNWNIITKYTSIKGTFFNTSLMLSENLPKYIVSN